MEKLLFICIVATFLNIFIIVYTFTLPFYPEHLRKKWNQDTFVGLFNLLISFIVCLLWILYFYYSIFYFNNENSEIFNFIFKENSIEENVDILNLQNGEDI